MEGCFCKSYNSCFSNISGLGEINSDKEVSINNGNKGNPNNEISMKSKNHVIKSEKASEKDVIVQGKVKEKCVVKIEKLKRSSKIKEKDLEGDVGNSSETKVEDCVNSNPLYSREDFELRNKDNSEISSLKPVEFSVAVDLVNIENRCQKSSPSSVSSKKSKKCAKEKVSRNIFSEREKSKVGSEFEHESTIESETESETLSDSSQETSKSRKSSKTDIRKIKSPKSFVTYSKENRCFHKKNQNNVPVSPRIRPGSSIIDIAIGKDIKQPSTSKDSFTKPLDLANKAKRKNSPEVSSTTPELTLKRKRGLGRDSDDGESCRWSDDEGICDTLRHLVLSVQF